MMSRAVSPSAEKSYGLARVCRIWRIPRSTVYARRNRDDEQEALPKKRGPRGPCSDSELVERIREVIEKSPWVGEGHRKVWARLRFEGIRTSRRRVLRLMREEDLLAPSRSGNPHGPRDHSGTIVTDRPDEMWGTDATSTLTGEGSATVFFVVDHCTAECLGIHAARRGTRFEALEPIRQAVRTSFGAFEPQIASGLALRHDHGSQFVSHYFQNELRLLGIDSSPAFVREPEGNGCAERFVRTLKEQLLWLHRFENVDQLNEALKCFQTEYNRHWLIERHGHRSPAAKRVELLEEAAA